MLGLIKFLQLNWKFLLWIIIVLPVFIAYQKNPQIFYEAFEFSKEHKNEFWFIATVILVPAFLFCLALPGSAFLWIIAPLYTPIVSSSLLIIGATLGGCGGYIISRSISLNWKERLSGVEAYEILRKHGSFKTLFALRIIPAFPHALVNYSAGVLHLNFKSFLLSLILGILPKTYIYSYAIHSAVEKGEPAELLTFPIVSALTVLAILPFILRPYLLRTTKAEQ